MDYYILKITYFYHISRIICYTIHEMAHTGRLRSLPIPFLRTFRGS